MSKFTVIPVMYYSGTGDKTYGAYVAQGEITDGQRERLKSSLTDLTGAGDEFIPQQIDRDHMGSNNHDLSSDVDGPAHSMDVDGIKVVEAPDGESPKINAFKFYPENVGEIEDFVSTMEKAKAEGWDPESFGVPDYDEDDWEDEDDPDEDGSVAVTVAPTNPPRFQHAATPSAGGGFDPNRVPAGSPKGGQFAPKVTAEATDVQLS